MPLKTWDNKQDWDAAYLKGAEERWGHPATRPEVKLHYCRAVQMPWSRSRATRLVAALGWQPTDRIVLVGAGFGWTAEALEELGFTSVVGCDVSRYVQDNKALSEEQEVDAAISAVGLNPSAGEGAALKAKLYDGGARTRASRGVLNEGLATPGSRRKIATALGGDPDWGLSESVLESLTDAEAQDISARVHSWTSATIAHFVVTLGGNQDPGYNWKTLEDWKALLPSDTFIEAGSFRVL
jgi:hypothetical protein